MSQRIRTAVIVACAVVTASCGGSSPNGPGPGSVNIDISASGPSPREVTVPVGSSVTFTNRDARPHAVSSDPVQTHTDCPAVNDVGTVNPGQSKSTAPLTVARVCGFHDHNNENDPTFKGRIIVQ